MILAIRMIPFLLLSALILGAQEDTHPPTSPEVTPPTSSTQPAQGPKKEVMAVPIKMVKPVYPFAAEQDQRQGKVIVKVLVNEKGEVESAEVISGDPIFQRAAMDAAKKWTFEPYQEDGKPTKFSIRLPFSFAFDGRVDDDPRGFVRRNASTSNGASALQVAAAVSQGLLIHRVTPIYPQKAKWNHTQGTVLLNALISKEGLIDSLSVVSGPADLVQSSIDAVQQWRYRPYLLNGEPVEVRTTVQVNYTLTP